MVNKRQVNLHDGNHDGDTLPPPAEDGPGSSQASPSHGGKSRRGSFGKETMETSGYKTERANPQWRQAAPASDQFPLSTTSL
jgi:hypothetical protein